MPKDITKKPAPKQKPAEPVKEELEPIKIMPVLNTEMKEDDDDFSPEDFIVENDLTSKPDRYFEAIGRRKTAVARVRLFTRGDKAFLVNGKPYQTYFILKKY